MPRSFAPAIPLGALALAVVVAAGVGIAAAPDGSSADSATSDRVVMRHHGHGLKELRKERKQLHRRLEKLGGPERKGPGGRGPLGLGPGLGAPGLGEKGLEKSPAFALLPDALQDDLRELVKADPEERRAMLGTIRTKALDGDYGAKVKEAFELLQQRGDR